MVLVGASIAGKAETYTHVYSDKVTWLSQAKAVLRWFRKLNQPPTDSIKSPEPELGWQWKGGIRACPSPSELGPDPAQPPPGPAGMVFQSYVTAVAFQEVLLKRPQQ